MEFDRTDREELGDIRREFLWPFTDSVIFMKTHSILIHLSIPPCVTSDGPVQSSPLPPTYQRTTNESAAWLGQIRVHGDSEISLCGRAGP